MPPSPTPRSYGAVRIWLHWGIVLVILAMIPTGVIMARTADDALRLDLYLVHLLLGWLVVALSVWRLVLRRRRPVDPPAGLARWNRALASGVHWTVAAFPLLLAVSGVGVIVQNDLGPLLQAGEAPPATLAVDQARIGHQVGAYLFVALLVVHVVGIVRHHARFGGAMAPMRPRGAAPRDT
jgi:cytochrome b561